MRGACIAVVLCALTVVSARADVVTYVFTSDHCDPNSSGCLPPGASNMGSITLTQNGANVDVHVALAAGFGFVATGAGGGSQKDGGPSFFFRLLNNPTITYSGKGLCA